MSKSPACQECGSSIPVKSKHRHGRQPTLCSAECRRRSHRKVYRKWYTANAKREAARRIVSYQKNPDYFGKYYEKNRERKKKQARTWYNANSERANEIARLYNVAHPDLIRHLGRKSAATRRALKKKVFVEVVDPKVVFDRDKGVCGICKRPVPIESKWEIDHVIPISKGGAHAYDNVQLAHRQCNRSKGNKLSLCHLRSP